VLETSLFLSILYFLQIYCFNVHIIPLLLAIATLISVLRKPPDISQVQ
jgi:hypothetical protein